MSFLKKINTTIKNKFSNKDGQLLIEILIAITVGSVFVIGATMAFVTMLRQNFENRGSQVASSDVYSMIDKVNKMATADWGVVYNLSKGSSNHYFPVLSATSSHMVPGDEGSLFNDISSGLIGHWGFDESGATTTYDSSGHFNNGTLINTPTRVASSSCKVGGCLLFNGSSNYVSIISSPNPSSSVSVFAWFKRNGSPANGYHIIFMQGTQIEISVPESTGEIRTGVTTDTQGRQVFNSGSGVTDGNWHFLSMTYDGANLISYIDGIQTASHSVSGALTIGSSANIGKYSGYYANGYIDDVRVYNRALSASEIQSIYNSSTYIRYFYIENVNRYTIGGDIANDGIGKQEEDPSTQKITGITEWLGGRSLSFSTYITRFSSNVFFQNSWSGGSGVDSITTTATTTFSTSTNILASSTLILASTTSSGYLTSVIFDTQSENGSALNSVMWNGEQQTGSYVKFQIAYSSNVSGPWNYLGNDGTANTYFTPTGPGVPYVINNINNYRYFRYQVTIEPGSASSSSVDSLSVNWSP